jgi:hypothetical protein
MKIAYKKLFILIALISFTYAAKAQYSAVPDTARITFGPDISLPVGTFGDSYKYGAGASVQLDVPLSTQLYVTGNVGYTMFSASSSSSNPNYILNVKAPNMSAAPLKLGLKFYLIRTFYIQGEAGETLLLNRTAVYGIDASAFTWAPQIGILFKLKNHNFIDGGIRWQKTQSFYGDSNYNTFWGFRAAYGFNLK